MRLDSCSCRRSKTYSISGRGTVVTGRVERGIIKAGEEAGNVGIKAGLRSLPTGVEMFRKLLDEGRAGENVGVLLRGIKREENRTWSGTGCRAPSSRTPFGNLEVYIPVQR